MFLFPESIFRCLPWASTLLKMGEAAARGVIAKQQLALSEGGRGADLSEKEGKFDKGDQKRIKKLGVCFV